MKSVWWLTGASSCGDDGHKVGWTAVGFRLLHNSDAVVSYHHQLAAHEIRHCSNGRLWRYVTSSYCYPPPFPQIDIIGAMMIVWRVRGKLSGLFCAILCATIVHSELHTHINRHNSSLEWVSHWAHLTVLRFISVYVMYVACMCSIVTRWGGPGGIEVYP